MKRKEKTKHISLCHRTSFTKEYKNNETVCTVYLSFLNDIDNVIVIYNVHFYRIFATLFKAYTLPCI